MIASWQEISDKPTQVVEKQRLYFVKKGLCSQGYGLPSGTYSCESWTVKKAECQGIEVFELWCWRRLLRSLWQQGDQTSQTSHGNQTPKIYNRQTDRHTHTQRTESRYNPKNLSLFIRVFIILPEALKVKVAQAVRLCNVMDYTVHVFSRPGYWNG